MSARGRLGLIVGAILVLAGLLLILRPKGGSDQAPSTAPGSPAAAAEFVLDVKGGDVTGDRNISVPQGTDVRLEVNSDVAAEVHVHGYDLMADVAPGEPARVSFTADVTGTFEVELENAGLELTELEVTP